MTEKKHNIMETAVKLFAEKGYHATSIQEIADTLGIAKGSLYFYFKSKEDLLVYICKYYLNLFLDKLLAMMEDTREQPRERLTKQVVMKIEQYAEHRDFITMFIKERFEVNEEIHQLIHMLRAQTLFATRNCLIELYGEEARPYSYDAATIFNSMSDGYLGLMFMDRMELNIQEIALFLVDRLDDIVKGMLVIKTKPMLNTKVMEEFIASGQRSGKKNVELLDEIQVIRGIVEQLNVKPEKLEEIQSSLLVLEEEFEKPEYQTVLIKGMLALLKSMKINDIKKNIAKIESYIY